MSSLVSVVIPAHNAERYISRAIGSVISQTYENLELIVVDDGSADKTADIIRSFEDRRVRYVYQKNRGQGLARNHGIKLSKGEYVAFLDADDVYLPRKIERQVGFVRSNPKYRTVYCNALHFFSEEPDRLYKKRAKGRSGNVLPELLESSLINLNTIMVAREVFERVGPFSEERLMNRIAEEWDLYLRIATAGFEFGYLDEDLVVVEIRRDSHTTWDRQWLIKLRMLELLENLFARASPEERERFHAEKILRNMKLKLAVAYLIGRQKRAFFETLVRLCPVKALAYCIGGVVLLLPSAFLRACLIRAWELRQRRGFELVRGPA